jgi:hypothetical protein
MTESFYITAILWALDLAAEIGESANRRISKSANQQSRKPGWEWGGRWLLLGLALGIATLLRQVILLFVPLLLAWLCWAVRKSQTCPERSRRIADRRLVLSEAAGGVEGSQISTSDERYAIRSTQCVTGLLSTLLVIGALIVPWTVRNYLAFGQFVLLNTNSGYAFFWANHPIHGTHFIDLLPTDGPSYQDLIPPELRSLDEATLDRALLERGLGFVREDPVRFLVLSLSRIPDYFQFWPSSRSALVSNLARVLSFGLFLPFMAWGLVLARHRWRACLLLYLFVAVYSLAHILSWTGPRYRLPVDAVLIVFAGLAVATLVERAIARWPRLVRLAGRWGRGIGAGEKRL